MKVLAKHKNKNIPYETIMQFVSIFSSAPRHARNVHSQIRLLDVAVIVACPQVYHLGSHSEHKVEQGTS